jgi:predicted secreted protein
MASYYVNQNAQLNGDHEVHTARCVFLPGYRTYLGEFTSCTPAAQTARVYYIQSNGCFYCCSDCHTT